MKKKFLTTLLLSIMFVFSICLQPRIFAFAESTQETEITVNDFDQTYWEHNLQASELITQFTSESKSFESTLSTNEAYTGSYSVVFQTGVITSETDDALKLVVALGEENAQSMSIGYTAGDGYYGSNDAIYIGFSAKKIYILDTYHNGSFADNSACPNSLGAYWKSMYDFFANGPGTMRLSRMRVKLEVVTSDDSEKDILNLYYINTDTANSFGTTPQYSIEIPKGVADGYLKFTQAYDKHSSTQAVESYEIKKLAVDGQELSGADLSVYGRTDLVAQPCDSITMYDASASTDNVISNFKVSDRDLNEGEEVFKLTFTSKRFATPETLAHAWGLVLGVDKSGDLSTGTKIRFVGTGILKLDSDEERASGRCGKLCDNNTGNLPNTVTTYTVTGYAGGRVEIQYRSVGCVSTCTGHTATFENVDFNGRIAFQIFTASEETNGYWLINDLSLTAHTTNAEYYSVTTVVDGVEKVSSVEEGSAFTPETPVKEGEIFVGWKYTDSDETEVYKHADFAINSVSENVSLTAVFVDLDVIGASIKVSGTQGFRFTAEINEESKALLDGLDVEVQYGILLTHETLGSVLVPCENWFNTEKTAYTAVLTGAEELNVTDDFTAKAYVEIDGVKYFSESKTRSMAYVADAAVRDFKTASEGDYIYELEDGKFYDMNYSSTQLAYLKELAEKYVA